MILEIGRKGQDTRYRKFRSIGEALAGMGCSHIFIELKDLAEFDLAEEWLKRIVKLRVNPSTEIFLEVLDTHRLVRFTPESIWNWHMMTWKDGQLSEHEPNKNCWVERSGRFFKGEYDFLLTSLAQQSAP